MTILEFKRMLIDSGVLRPGGRGVWWHAKVCPFCGNNKWKFYLYININDDSSVGYDCKRCNCKSYSIDNTVLESLGFVNVDIPKFKGVKHVKRNGEYFNDVEILTPDMNIQKIQNYIYSRIGVVPSFEDLKAFKYVGDPVRYLKMVSSEEFNPNKFINRFCFKLTNGGLLCRYHNDSRNRWITHSMSKNGSGLYTIITGVDPMKPINVCITEGIFDAIGLYYNLNLDNAVYIATCGTNYSKGLSYLIDKGFFGRSVSVGIYKDSDVDVTDIRYNRRYKRLFKSINVYENIIGHDYGCTKDKLEIHKVVMKGVKNENT